jgi:F0F1-type ATP synthase assembly protein I
MVDDTRNPSDSEDGPSDPERAAPGMIGFLSMSLAIALCLVFGGLVGFGIDAATGSSPLWTLVGLGFGVAAAVLLTVANVRRYL